MKIKLKLFLVLLVSFVVGAISVEAVSTEKEFTVNQWFTNLYYTESGILAGTHKSSFPPEQFLITKEEPNWSSLTDEELRDKPSSWVLKNSNYTYWGYSIIYQDQTTEFFNESSFTYESLSSLELERGKEIIQIDIMYGDTGSVTINYNLIKSDGSTELLKSDYSYGLFSANLPGKVELIGQSTNLDQMIENYIIVSQDEEAPFYYEENKDKVININLRNPQYTIHFTDELGNKIRESEKIFTKVGELFDYIAPIIEGYSVKVNDTISEMYLKEDKEFTIIYQKLADPVEEGKVIVKYEDSLGNTISESTTLTGKVGESYQTTEKEIEGYNLIDVIGESVGVYSQSDQEVIYIYKKTEVPAEEGKIIIKYEDNSGNAISESTTLTGKIGESYKIKQKEISGYKLITVKGEPEGVYSQSPKEIIFIYQKITEKNTEKKNVKSKKNTPDEQNNSQKLPKTGESYLHNSMTSILGSVILGGLILLLFNKKRKTN
jgi:LPXTG-motif cell wall-anchored protein